MDGVQTTLQIGKAPQLEEFKKQNLKPIKYMLEKYKQWKELKEKEKNKGGYNAVPKPETL